MERRRRRGHLRHPPREGAPGRGPRARTPWNDEEEQFHQEGECARRPRARGRLCAPGTPARRGSQPPRALLGAPARTPRPVPRPPRRCAARRRGAAGGLLFVYLGAGVTRVVSARPPASRPRAAGGRVHGAPRTAAAGDNEK